MKTAVIVYIWEQTLLLVQVDRGLCCMIFGYHSDSCVVLFDFDLFSFALALYIVDILG